MGSPRQFIGNPPPLALKTKGSGVGYKTLPTR